MIKSIIFDIGLVLVDYDWKKYLSTFHYDEDTFKAVSNAVFLSDTWIECDRGVLSEAELLDSFIHNAPSFECEIKDVLKNIGDCIKQFPYAIPWIKELKNKGLRIYVLSNYGEQMYLQTKKELNFLDLVDGGIISYRDKLIKPDPKVYQTLLNRYCLDADETLFLDDNVDNIRGADALGIHTILFTDYTSAVHKMKSMGI